MGEILSGINIAKQEVANMTVEAIYVAPDAVNLILNQYKLTPEQQEAAVNALVDRTPDWLELESETQTEKIKICLTQETVTCYLEDQGLIRDDCNGYNVGMRSDDGAIVVEAMYVHMNRAERRQWEKRARSIAKQKAKRQQRKVISLEERRKNNEK